MTCHQFMLCKVSVRMWRYCCRCHSATATKENQLLIVKI